ncbi:hypothetical protein [Streptomyces globisporus]|uniref:hypothetical protein n=1 Tax=Streptomyces globisporus TaxID=1908 RepID=UPI0036916534
MTVEQSNGVNTYVRLTEDGEIIFDLHVPAEPNMKVSGNSLYQNLSIEDAKAIRRALKKAIEESTA